MRWPWILVALAACKSSGDAPGSSGQRDAAMVGARDAAATAVEPTAPPDAASPPPPLAATTIAGIEKIMRPWTGDDRPGCALGVVRRDHLVFARGFGMADVAGHVPITPGTIFDLGSTSKQMTAALVHLLIADGKLALDDTLVEHVPEVAARRGRAITIADLMHHTSGLPDYIGLLDAEYEDVTTGADALAAIAEAKPLREPGVEHEYSNSGYFLLGLIVERLSGQPLAEVAAARLFAPLGMTRTRVGDGGQTAVQGLARGYAHGKRGAKVVTSGWQQVGDGAVLSTVVDLARWDHEFYVPVVGGQALLDAMLRPGELDDGTELEYASGLYVGEHDGRALVSHSGSWTGFGAELLRFPAERTSVICLCNFDDSDPEALALRIADVVLAEPP